MKIIKVIYLFAFSLIPFQAIPCTTGIVSGKYTPDGRPLLFKQRDTGALDNKIMHFDDGKYPYIGLVNSNDSVGNEVWGGYNSTGFAIINSASYNLNPPNNGLNKEEREGIVMKMALQKCATLADFEKLLNELPKPMFLNTNFGVIDSKGEAAYYETGDYKFTKFDANNNNTAPMGYIIRTNFSFSGDRSKDLGLSRLNVASNLFYQASLTNSLTHQFILKDVSRSLKHGITDMDLYDTFPDSNDGKHFVAFRDYIPRYSTSSCIVIQGVKKDENPILTTMWTILGSPLSSVTIPVWMNPEQYLPKILVADETGKAPLCSWSLILKKLIFPIERGEGHDYIDLSKLVTKDKNGILQKTRPIEDKIIKEGESLLDKWRKSGIDYQEQVDFYNWVDLWVRESYFGIFPELDTN